MVRASAGAEAGTACRRWRAAALQTGRADRERAERGVCRAYAAAGLGPVRRVLWYGSPLTSLTACVGLAARDGLASVWRALVDATDRERSALHAAAPDLADRVRREVVDALVEQVRNPVWLPVDEEARGTC
ncbi:MAG TPA: hypothetical protein VD813_10755, partial [Pseudonocardia sp.]|nr:hypothetical protein [Pseudonocardia sp.]